MLSAQASGYDPSPGDRGPYEKSSVRSQELVCSEQIAE